MAFYNINRFWESYLLIILFFPIWIYSQKSFIEGHIISNADKKPIKGVLVIAETDDELETKSNNKGYFRLSFEDTQNIKEIILIAENYELKKIQINSVNINLGFITLKKSFSIGEVVISNKDIISHDFSIIKLKRNDIWSIPSAFGDPVLAVGSFPSITNNDESSEPSFRGSSSIKSVIYFDNTPLYKASRFQQINGLGTFSIFNSNLISNINVYPSNPPSTYGNTSAGVISFSTINDLTSSNQYGLNIGLSGVGGEINAKISNNASNYTYMNNIFSDITAKLNTRGNIGEEDNFSSLDIGNHFIYKKNKDLMKLTSYFNTEDYSYAVDHINNSFSKKRAFNILNYSHNFNPKTILSISLKYDITKSDFSQNSLKGVNDELNTFNAVTYHKKYKKIETTSGLSIEGLEYRFKNSLNKSALKTSKNTFNFYHHAEWKNLLNHFSLSLGARYNSYGQWDYNSNIKYRINKKQALILSYGNYSSLSIPNTLDSKFYTFKSNQLSLDYGHKVNEKFDFKLSVFHKKEIERKINYYINGIELYGSCLFGRYIKTSLGGSIFSDHNIKPPSDLNVDNEYISIPKYSLKFNFIYDNPNLFTIGLSSSFREGPFFYTIEEINNTIPLFSNPPNHADNYFRSDITLSRVFIKNHAMLIPYFSLINITDHKNFRSLLYDQNLTPIKELFYQRLSFYLGLIIKFIPSKQS